MTTAIFNPAIKLTPIQAMAEIATSTVSATTKEPIESAIQRQCLTLEPKPPDGTQLPGVLVLKDADIRKPNYLLDLSRWTRTELPIEPVCVSTSPDGKWLLCLQRPATQTNSGLFAFESADGKLETRYSYYADMVLNEWLDGEHYSISQIMSSEKIPPVIVFDLSTGDKQLLHSDYPGLEPYDGAAGSPFQFLGRSVAYSPTLQFVVYPKTTKEDRRYIVLWDLKAQKEVAGIEDQGCFRNDPLWSLDGTQVFVAVATTATSARLHEELFQMDPGGQVTQLTRFGITFENLNIEVAAVSPKGDRLAFWLTEDDAYNSSRLWRLVIMNLVNHEMMDYCVTNVRSSNRVVTFSPDGQFIATLIGNLSGGDNSRAIIIDLSNEWATQVADSVFLTGWLKSP
jgi:WD40 repeat protein